MDHIAAFDLGTKNFAFAVKDENFLILKNIRLDDTLTRSELSKQNKQDLNMLMSALNISTTSQSKKKDMVDLIIANSKKGKNKLDLCTAFINVLNQYKNVWDLCGTFLIERQMNTNLQALKMSHYLEMYLKIYYPNSNVLNYNSSLKTKKLGASNINNKKDRKEWTIAYVSNLLQGEHLTYFESLEKKDDVADAVCMIESYLK